MKLLIVGYGKMGRMVEELATARGHSRSSAASTSGARRVGDADVAIDFSTADALLANFKQYTSRRLPAVIGTTGWNAHVDQLRAEAERAGIGVVASANFSIGVNVFQLIVAEAARLMTAQPQFGAWIHEIHHAAKRDAPSGTALLLRDAMVAAGFNRPIDMSSARAGMIPGTHTVGFDGASDTIELIHRARDRRGFASWRIAGGAMDPRAHGWFTCRTCWNHAGRWHRLRRGSYGLCRSSTRRSTMRTPFTGVGTALITPFTRDGSLDEAAVKRLARRQIDARRALPVALRDDRRGADADASREAARGGAGR